jgi:hypothetical protein
VHPGHLAEFPNLLDGIPIRLRGKPVNVAVVSVLDPSAAAATAAEIVSPLLAEEGLTDPPDKLDLTHTAGPIYQVGTRHDPALEGGPDKANSLVLPYDVGKRHISHFLQVKPPRFKRGAKCVNSFIMGGWPEPNE